MKNFILGIIVGMMSFVMFMAFAFFSEHTEQSASEKNPDAKYLTFQTIIPSSFSIPISPNNTATSAPSARTDVSGYVMVPPK